MTAYSKPLPAIDERSRPFWDAAARHELCLPRCLCCGHYRTQFEATCPRCLSQQFEWARLSGLGSVWSFCFFHKAYFGGFADDVPYNVLLVRLEEGPLLVEYANPAQKEKYLGDLLTQKKTISLGMSEPGAGSAVTELATSAVRDGDSYLLNGTKIFGTHSHDADLYLIYVRFGPGAEGIGSVLVDRNTEGFNIGPPKAFMNGENWSELHFDDCRIPEGNILLGSGGFKKQISSFNVERLGNAARAVALGRHAFETAKRHALERCQFGRPLCEFQGLQWKFADMEMRLSGAQLMLMRAAVRAKGGLPSAQESALAKLACNEAGFFASNEALQIMGAAGFSQESTVQYCLRRTRGWMIAGGTVEILKNRIAESIFDRRFSQRPEPALAAQ